MKKKLIIVALSLVAAIGLIASYVKIGLPNIKEPEELTVNRSPERIARGSYLAHHVALCMDCHSTRDWSKFGGPMVAGTFGKGGELFNEEMGLPGTIYSKNITPYHLKDWTDGQLFRAITTGVSKDGSALFPLMPYLRYGKMDKEDVYDIIAYIRSLDPIESQQPNHILNFPMNFIVNTIPTEAAFVTRPLPEDTIQYGAYLANMASCVDCHTQVKAGQPIFELEYSGGRDFNLPNGIVRSANLTPDNETGIGKWTAETFVARFKAYENEEALYKLKPDQINSVMPWGMFAKMDTTDLRAIFAYLKSLKPIQNKVIHFSKPTEIKSQ